MSTLEQRIKFAEKFITNKSGERFDLTGREWVIDEFWKPADGWKIWPKDPKPGNDPKLCDDCSGRAGGIVEWSRDLVDDFESHGVKCDGLKLEPIIMTVLNLPRREGKTFNTAAFNLSDGLINQHKYITFMASAEGQTGQLFDENYRIAIENDPALERATEIVGNTIKFTKTGSFFECVPTASSVTGRGRSRIVIDEAKDVTADVAMRLIPSVFAENGWECPRGHMHTDNSPDIPKRCPVCRSDLVPWQGRILIMSSSGILKGGEKDWFAELVERLEKHPDPSAHLYVVGESTNPRVNKKATGMMERVFGQMDSTKTYVDVEVHNVSRRPGEDFVGEAQINAVVDSRLYNLEGSDRPSFAFLDTSKTGELTSWVIFSDDVDRSEYPWEHIISERIDIWDPKLQPGRKIKKAIIRKHLQRYMPMFPRLMEVLVDVRGGLSWAIDLVEECNAEEKAWGKKIKAFYGGGKNQTQDRQLAWDTFETRILERRILLPDHPTMRAELRGVKSVKRPDGTREIKDRNRKVRHADVIEGMAQVCYRIWKEQTVKKAGFGKLKGRKSQTLRELYRPKALRDPSGAF